MSKLPSHLPELVDLAKSGSIEELKEKLQDLQKKGREKFIESLPDFMGYGTTMSGKMFTEIYLDGDEVCLTQGLIEDYDKLIKNPVRMSKEAFTDRALAILEGMDKVQDFTDKEGAIRAYGERLEARTSADKDGLLKTLYKGSKEVNFHQFSSDELISVEYSVDGTIVKYLKKQTEAMVSSLRKELKLQGYKLVPEDESDYLGDFDIDFTSPEKGVLKRVKAKKNKLEEVDLFSGLPDAFGD